eukprot:TRINITY_DN702_c0_g1_i2.p1 TRINITY_DN702_c0_g1~~TRINITY_DN702_c0_g1_i2.p1  ORF type:complete len:883 (+),score=302.91 TRINITY_DN702_c0_g1_i2:200-2848(+)
MDPNQGNWGAQDYGGGMLQPGMDPNAMMQQPMGVIQEMPPGMQGMAQEDNVYGGFETEDQYGQGGEFTQFGENGADYDFNAHHQYNMNMNTGSARQGLPGTAMAKPGTGAVPGTGFRMGTAMGGVGGGRQVLTTARPGTGAPGDNGARPMTSIKGAGYTSLPSRMGSARPVFDPMGGPAQAQPRGPAPPLQKREENSPEDLCRELERQVNTLIEESACANADKNLQQALDKAKEAAKRERQLCREREKAGLADQINSDLTYAVCFNLANQYDANSMYTEALNTYSLIVKDKNYPNAGRLRVNMGNIYFKMADVIGKSSGNSGQQGKYTNAIKMYRMALDQIPTTAKEIRFRILRNISIAFIRLGQFQDAIQNFEQIMESGVADFQSGFNLILCYYAHMHKDKMKKGFASLIELRQPQMDDAEEDSPTREGLAKMKDDLLVDLTDRQKKAESYITTAAKLVAPVIEKDMDGGYMSVIEQLKLREYPHLASELEMTRAIAFLKNKQFDQAIESFKELERKEKHNLASSANNNLSFMYFLQGDYNNALKYAEEALSAERWNAAALVNKANCLFQKKKYEDAKKEYILAVQAEGDCHNAIYNLALSYVQLKQYPQALEQFMKLQEMVPDTPDVLYHIANIHEITNKHAEAAKFYSRLMGACPNDPGILAKLGSLYNKQKDDPQAFYYYEMSYRYYPVNMDVISWLGAWYVKSNVFEKAISFFERAAQIEPDEVKWQLMIASCHRRSGHDKKALVTYQAIHRAHSDNVECLKYMVQCAERLGMHEEASKYNAELARATRDAQRVQYDQAQRSPGTDSSLGVFEADRNQGFLVRHGQMPAAAPVHVDMGDVSVAQKTKGKTVAQLNTRDVDDDDWGNDELGDDLLPDT